MFRMGDVGLGYYYNDDRVNLPLERLRQDYIMTNQAPKEGGNEVPPLLSLVSLPDLAGSSSLDDAVRHPFTTKKRILTYRQQLSRWKH